MKNCIYDLICIEDPSFCKYRPQIEKEFCKEANCDCKCCALFVEIDNLNDFKRRLISIVSHNNRSIKGKIP